VSTILWWALASAPLWAVVGSIAVPRRYRTAGQDPGLARTAGTLLGLATGPAGLAWLYARVPPLRSDRHVLAPALLLTGEAYLVLRAQAPGNVCMTSGSYVLNQIQGGILVGAVLATVAVGLTLVYSVLGVVSFTHGQFVMVGGVTAYLLLTEVWQVNPVAAIPVVGLAMFALGAAVEMALLSPMHRGRVDRKDEYAILITFGFGVFLQYAVLGLLGPTSGLRAPRYTDRPLFGLDATSFTVANLRLDTNFLITGVVGVLLCAGLTMFLRHTWSGRALRAVSMNPQAAAVAGIDSGRSFTVAFGLGAMLAGMAGAALVPAVNFPIPDIAGQMAIVSYVIVVLGGLGSVPGAFLGGLFIGVVQSLGAGCYPDPSKGAVYQTAFGLVIFAFVLLARPRGFFGRHQ